LWTEDAQDDWFTSATRATVGSNSAQVRGLANNAQLNSVPINLQGNSQATITFKWLIENSLDSGDYAAFDVSTNGGSSWT
jgi:ABC-type transporter MlaC component